jgi:superfamily I DNA/RNA helicase
MNQLTYFGPPGTGKTTTLLKEVENAINSGVSADRVGFMSFTKQAINEAAYRTGKSIGELPYFRTIHSMCFRLCGMSKSKVMEKNAYVELGELLGLEITGGFQKRKALEELSDGDKAIAAVDICRLTMTPLKEGWKKIPGIDEIDWLLLEQVDTALREFKKSHLLVDYTGMIEEYIERGAVPNLDLLIVDEAQDLSPLQWKAIDKLCSKSKKMIIAGDDDQSIYYWAGARPEFFKKVTERGESKVLSQSYRLPVTIHSLAQSVVKRISGRVEKEYKPRNEQGSIEYCASLDDVDMSKGSWLVLYRNRYMVKEAVEHCKREGYHYTSFFDSPSDWASLKAIIIYESLRKGSAFKLFDIKKVMSFYKNQLDIKSFEMLLPVKGAVYTAEDIQKEVRLFDCSKPWFETLNVHIEEMEYFRAALRRGEKLTQPARIRIDTIHGAKGSESENVVVGMDLSYKVYQSMEKDEDQEARVFYVAITRAKQNLFLLQPTTPFYYSMGEI